MVEKKAMSSVMPDQPLWVNSPFMGLFGNWLCALFGHTGFCRSSAVGAFPDKLSVRYAEAESLKNTTVLIADLHSPGAFVGFS